jgi:hypothetical protein
LTAWIAVSWARANRASMGAKLTLPPRRCRTIIPASVGRVLATPWAFGRISVTVDLVVTCRTKQRLCQVTIRREINNLWNFAVLPNAAEVTRCVSS